MRSFLTSPLLPYQTPARSMVAVALLRCGDIRIADAQTLHSKFRLNLFDFPLAIIVLGVGSFH